MSYLVFARKWRPALFSEVVGQEHVSRTLENAITQDRLASAYIFSGPRGVGKTTTARILAKALNCEKGPTPTPCNSCSACTEIAQGQSIDVLEIDGASNRGIDEVRNLRESTRYTPARRKYKVYIVDEVHMLTTEAFNALLKTLEEPPPHVVFLFATTESNKVPATILSRCQRFDFRRIAPAEIVAQLQKICEHESIEIEANALYVIARKADGSMRDSQSLLDQVVSFCGTKITESDVTSLLGIVSQDLYFALTDAILASDLKSIIQTTQQAYEDGTNDTALIFGLTEHLNNLLVLKTTGSTASIEGMEGYADRFKETADRFSELDLIRMIQVTSEAAERMKRSANAHLLLEVTVARLARMPGSVELASLLAGDTGEKKKSLTPPEEPKEPSPPPAAPPRPQLKMIPEIDPERVNMSLFQRLSGVKTDAPNGGNGETPAENDAARTASDLQLDEVMQCWPKVLTEIKTRKIAIGSFLETGKPAAVNGNLLQITFPEGNGFQLNSIRENRILIQDMLTAAIGKRIRIECIQGAAAAAVEKEAKPEPEPEAEDETPSEPSAAPDPGPAPATPDLPSEPAAPAPAPVPPPAGSHTPGNNLTQKLIESLGGEPLR